MITENRTELHSSVEAIMIARQATKANLPVPVEPCNQCPYMDRKLTQLCTDPDGILVDNGTLICPKQKGKLVSLTFLDNYSINPVDITNPQIVNTTRPLISSHRERRPYFVK